MLFWRRLLCKLRNFIQSSRSEEEQARAITSHRTLLTDERSFPWLEQTRQDVRLCVRTLPKSLGFTITSISALAIGIGANTAIFSVIDAVLLKPLPFPTANRLVMFVNKANGESITVASPVEFNFWQQQTSVLQDVSAYRYGRINLTGVDRPAQIQLADVNTSYFRLFGLSLARGREFNSAEDRPHGADVVIISESFWRRTLSSDPGMIGKYIGLGGKPYEVIGIMAEGPQAEVPVTSDPSSFQQKTQVWRPLQIDSTSTDGNGYLTVAARLRSGVALAAANAELERATQQFRRNIPGMAQHSVFAVRSMQTVLDHTVGSQLSILSVSVGFVLLIACLNVASLSLSRSLDRRREISIRAAIGAGRSRLIRQLLTESVILSVAGGAFGVMVGFAGIRGLLALDSTHIPRIGQYGSMVTADWRVLLFTATLSVITGILFGLLPAFHGSSTDLNEILKQGAGRSSAGFWKQNARSLFVVAEIAIALVLLIGTAQMIRGFVAVRFANPGFDPRNVLAMRMSLTGTRFENTTGLSHLADASVSRLSGLPGVLSAAATCCVPLDSVDDYLIGDVIIAGRSLNGRSHGSVNVTTVTPGYFGVLKIPLLQGRTLAVSDNHDSEPVVVISQAFAHKFWANGLKSAPLDARLIFPDAPKNRWRIVGVVADIHAAGLENTAPPIVYFSMAQAPEELAEYIVRSPIGWLIRTREDSRGIRSSLQTQLAQASGGLPVANIRSMDDILGRSVAERQFNMILLTIFGASALLLAAVGVYGLIAHSMQQRIHEIGIRVALGAEPRNVSAMVVFQGLRIAICGVAVGTFGSWVLTRSIQNFLFSFKMQDPVAFLSAPILLVVVALFATWVPARSASNLDPVQALRHE